MQDDGDGPSYAQDTAQDAKNVQLLLEENVRQHSTVCVKEVAEQRTAVSLCC